VIHFKNVSRTYQNGTEALRNVNLDIEYGEFVFIVGHSGAGKSSMVRLLMCEDLPTEGDLIVDGTNTRSLTHRQIPKFRRRIGVVFQDFRLIPALDVYNNIAFAMRVVGKPRSEIKKRVRRVLELVELSHKIHSKIDELSGGEQQRVALARALVNNPSLIIADEPTGNVDPKMSMEIMRLLNAINKTGITIVVVTHEHRMIKVFNKRIVELGKGKVVLDTKGDDSDEL